MLAYNPSTSSSTPAWPKLTLAPSARPTSYKPQSCAKASNPSCCTTHTLHVPGLLYEANEDTIPYNSLVFAPVDWSPASKASYTVAPSNQRPYMSRSPNLEATKPQLFPSYASLDYLVQLCVAPSLPNSLTVHVYAVAPLHPRGPSLQVTLDTMQQSPLPCIKNE